MTREYEPTRTKTGATRAPSFAPVRTGLLQRKCACGGTPGLDGECAGCRKERLGLQRRAMSQTGTSAPPIVHDVLRSPGQPLDADTRAFMEPRFGHDFGRVRVHTDARAAESAEAVDALAYTVGENLVFGTGRYAPGMGEGRRLLAHELAHVVQQSGAAEAPATTALPVGDPASHAERAADRAASAASAPAQPRIPRSLQRQAVGAGPAGVPDDLRTRPAVGPLVEATPFRSRHASAWENPNLAQVIYPHRDRMLQRFLELYRELEYQDISTLPESQREEPLNRVRAQIQKEIAWLNHLPTTEPDNPPGATQVAELRALLERGQGVGQVALQMARDWLKRPVNDLHGDQLLAEVRAQFGVSNVPAWAQPLILDYSGMRYKSAHGTRVPPRQLLFAIVEADRPRGFAKSREGRELERSLRSVSDEQALGRLQAMHGAGQISPAAWRVIVRHTDLRLETTEVDWESAATDREIDPRWRGILEGWRQGADTAWHAELMRRNALVVTQIVCNQLGEAAQRQREIRLPGGIAANSEWFRRRANETATGPSPAETTEGAATGATAQGAYFVHGPHVRPDHLRPGAVLFFLSNEWSKTLPGDHARVSVVPSVEYPVPWPSNVPKERRSGTRPAIRDGYVDEEGWTYHVSSDQIWRVRHPKALPSTAALGSAAPIAETPSTQGPEQKQWMKWQHQATVLRRAGDLVVTLETTDTGAGVNNRSLASMRSQFVFVGWAPEPAPSGSTSRP